MQTAAGTKKPRIGFVTCVHPIYNLPSVIQHRDAAVRGLEAGGCEVVAPEIARDSRDVRGLAALLKKEDVDLVLLFFCTWVAEEITLALARELAEIPLLLWALPFLDRNIPMPSPITGLTATGCNIRRLGRSYSHMVGAATADHVARAARSARVAAVWKGLRHTRFGIFGSQCPGMIDTGCDESLLERRLGVTAIHKDLDNLLRAGRESSQEEASALAAGLAARVDAGEVGLERLTDHYRLYLGMKSIVERDQLDGFSVRCWPELRDQHKTTICLTLAEMAEAGVSCVCEADLTALVTSHILTALAGSPSYAFDVSAYLEPEQALQMAHCGSAAISLAGDPGQARVRAHMRTGTGTCLEFGFKPGVVTIAKLLRPADGRIRMFIGRGEAIATPPEVRGSVATIRVEPDPARFLDVLLREAVEHHLVVVYGDWTGDLAQLCDFGGIEPIRP